MWIDALLSWLNIAKRSDLKLLEDKFVMTQKELTTQVNALSAQIGQIGTETDTLIEKVKTLEEALANQDNASQELVDAVAAVSAQLKIVDDKVPDVTDIPATPVA